MSTVGFLLILIGQAFVIVVTSVAFEVMRERINKKVLNLKEAEEIDVPEPIYLHNSLSGRHPVALPALRIPEKEKYGTPIER